ncbi:hypothetical protein Taro_048595 [Colocasia esculenta]|uniref:Transposase n=1 Tax=Colocasia esculenta TaxID=4460 RepID=A0A843X8K2_COLES|nr:hypothetical protein [Colocasia esculenta]
MSLTCHFVDKDWNLQKRILNFVNLKSHSGVEIAKVIKAKLFDWNIDGKICSVILDNAFSNNVLTRELCQLLQPRGRLLLNGALFRVHCCCHILNLIVQVGLQPLEMTVSKIRESVRHVRSSHVRLDYFKKAAEQTSAPKKKLVLDVPTRWNSSYMMLSVAYEFRDAFERLSYFDSDYNGPSHEEWENVKVAKDCLELFYHVIKRFSGTKYPTANLYFNDVCLIHCTLKKWLKDSCPFIVSMAAHMLEKFNKYWSTLSLILSFGCILDPRYKLKTIEFFFDKIYPITQDGGSESDRHIDNIRVAFAKLYHAYVEEQMNISMDIGFIELDLWLKESSTNQPNKIDLELYFELPVLTNYSANFDVLAWWNEEEGKFPILAKIARDILSIPISTVASESAFSTGGRILDSYRSSPIALGTIPLAPNLDAETVVEEDVILQAPSYFNDDEDDELQE